MRSWIPNWRVFLVPVGLCLSGCVSTPEREDPDRSGTGQISAAAVVRPPVLEWHASRQRIRQRVGMVAMLVRDREITSIQVPSAREFQWQLDFEGFSYAGVPREVECLFADDRLVMVWILTEADEEAALVQAFQSIYGAPSFRTDNYVVFMDAGAAVRSRPPEVLFFAPSIAAEIRVDIEED